MFDCVGIIRPPIESNNLLLFCFFRIEKRLNGEEFFSWEKDSSNITTDLKFWTFFCFVFLVFDYYNDTLLFKNMGKILFYLAYFDQKWH